MQDTPSKKLAQQYLDLGGTRRAKIDDNIADTRKWDEEPAEATRFWNEKIAVLTEEERREVETLLPSIDGQ